MKVETESMREIKEKMAENKLARKEIDLLLAESKESWIKNKKGLSLQAQSELAVKSELLGIENQRLQIKLNSLYEDKKEPKASKGEKNTKICLSQTAAATLYVSIFNKVFTEKDMNCGDEQRIAMLAKKVEYIYVNHISKSFCNCLCNSVGSSINENKEK